MPSGSDHNPPDRARPVCVVLSSPGRTPAPALLAALERHALGARPVSTLHHAMAELCRPDGAARRARRVLLIADDAARAGAERVMRSARRFAPEAACWIYDPRANPPVRAHVEEATDLGSRMAADAARELEDPRPAPDARRNGHTVRTPAGSPMLRLIAADDPLPPSPALPEDEEPTAQRLLSVDELTMLLAEDDKKGRKP